ARTFEGRSVAVVPRQAFTEIPGNGFVDLLQVDHLIALEHAEAQCAVGFETDNSHDCSLARLGFVVAATERAGKAKSRSSRRLAATMLRRSRRAGEEVRAQHLARRATRVEIKGVHDGETKAARRHRVALGFLFFVKR